MVNWWFLLCSIKICYCSCMWYYLCCCQRSKCVGHPELWWRQAEWDDSALCWCDRKHLEKHKNDIIINRFLFSPPHSPLLHPSLLLPPPLLPLSSRPPSSSPPLTWPPTGLHLQEELLRLHVEEYEVAAGERHHHVIRVAADQVHWGGTSQFWHKHTTDVK